MGSRMGCYRLVVGLAWLYLTTTSLAHGLRLRHLGRSWAGQIPPSVQMPMIQTPPYEIELRIRAYDIYSIPDGSSNRSQFVSDLLYALSTATGAPPSSFRIISFRQGSVIVRLAVYSTSNMLSSQIVDSIATMLRNPASALYDQSLITQFLDPAFPLRSIGYNTTISVPTDGNFPLNPSTKKRYEGIKEFVIVAHDNLINERRELDAYKREEAAEYNALATRFKAFQDESTAEIKPFDTQINTLNRKIDSINYTVNAIRKRIAKRQVAIDHAYAVINDTALSWNMSITAMQTQLKSADDAVAQMEILLPLLHGPHPAASIASILKRTQGSAESSVSSLLQEAIAQVQTVTGIKEMETALQGLNAKLLEYQKSKNQEISDAVVSRDQHIANLNEKLDPFLQKIADLNKDVEVNYAAVPALQEEIREIDERRSVVLKELQLRTNRVQRFNDLKDDVLTTYNEELANLNARSATVEELHQSVKRMLLIGRNEEKTLLLSLTNIMKPKGAASQMPWNSKEQVFDPVASNPMTTHNVTESSTVDPYDGSEQLCANWRFDEADGVPYAMDAGPFGFDGRIHGSSGFMRSVGFDKVGRALEFDGMQTYVDVGTLGKIGLSLGSFTIDLWIRTLDTHSDLSSIVKVIEHDISTVLALEPNRRVGLSVEHVTGEQASTDLDFEPGATLCYLRDTEGRVLAGHVMADYFDNKWHHVQWIVISAAKNQMAFYMDDQLYPWVATIEQAPRNFTAFHQHVFIGAGNNRGTPEGHFDGALDNFRIFCTANVTVPQPTCCRYCDNPCGDLCIEAGTACHLMKGCACVKGPHPSPTPKPTAKEEETDEGEDEGWTMGSSPLNKYPLFANDSTPHEEAPGVTRRLQPLSATPQPTPAVTTNATQTKTP